VSRLAAVEAGRSFSPLSAVSAVASVLSAFPVLSSGLLPALTELSSGFSGLIPVVSSGSVALGLLALAGEVSGLAAVEAAVSAGPLGAFRAIASGVGFAFNSL
jgi:hypothetical protein